MRFATIFATALTVVSVSASDYGYGYYNTTTPCTTTTTPCETTTSTPCTTTTTPCETTTTPCTTTTTPCETEEAKHHPYTTVEVTTSYYTTFCEHPTTLIDHKSTYVITTPTTLTLPRPCTNTKTFTTVTATSCYGDCIHTPPPVYPNSTVPTGYPVPPATTYAPTHHANTTYPPVYTGAAASNKVTFAGAALAGFVAAAAYIL